MAWEAADVWHAWASPLCVACRSQCVERFNTAVESVESRIFDAAVEGGRRSEYGDDEVGQKKVTVGQRPPLPTAECRWKKSSSMYYGLNGSEVGGGLETLVVVRRRSLR